MFTSDLVTASFKDFLKSIKTLSRSITRSAKSKILLISQCIARDNSYWAIICTATPATIYADINTFFQANGATMYIVNFLATEYAVKIDTNCCR